MTYRPSTELRIKALESAVITLAQSVIQAHDALTDVAGATTDQELKAKLDAKLTDMRLMIEELVATVAGNAT